MSPIQKHWQPGRKAWTCCNRIPIPAVTENGTPPTLARAIERYEFAVARSPSFAKGLGLPCRSLRLCVCVRRKRPRSGRAASRDRGAQGDRADPRLAKGHAMLGLVLFCLSVRFQGC